MVIGHLTGKDTGPHLQAEGRRIAELRSEGPIRNVFVKAGRTGPILVLNDTNADEARDRLAGLPFVEPELVTLDYIELGDDSPA